MRPKHLLRRVAALACLAALFALAVSSTSASGDVSNCKKVYGKGGKATKGYARVCLEAFDSENGSATLRVTKQKRNSAPHNVYVQAGFTFGGYNTGTSRLGPNAPKTYRETIETSAADPEGVIVKLCYDKRLRKDPCFKSKVLTSLISGGSRR